MRLTRRLDFKLTLLILVVVLVAAAVQSVVSILYIIRTYNEFSLQAMQEQWAEINRVLADGDCVDAACIRNRAPDFPYFDRANPVYLTDLEGRVILVLPRSADLAVGESIVPRETMGDLYLEVAEDGTELAFVRGELRAGEDQLGWIYTFQYPLEEAGAYFGLIELYSPLAVRGVIVSLAVAAVLAVALIGLLTRRLRRLTEAVSDYDPERGLPTLRFRGKDEIATLAERFEAMSNRITALIGELQRADVERKQLIAGISHDLRSPVTSLGVGLELLEGTGADAKMLESLREDVDFLSRLIDDLFAIVRIRDREGGPEKTPELIGEILERAARSQFPVAAKKGVAIDVLIGDIPETMVVNGKLLFRLLDNLIRNAVAHAPAGSRVCLSANSEAGVVRFDVTDEGPGFTGDPQAIFGRYVSRREGGVGLGLSLAREIALSHGGTINAVNRTAAGARLTVRLPIETAA